MGLENQSIIAWLHKNEIVNEKGQRIEFHNHPFLFDIYRERSQNLVVMKAAQVGMTTLEMIKNHYDAKYMGLDIIYTLPTDGDVHVLVGGKMNRIIANNPTMLADVADKDSVEQKKVGENMIYFRGTWTKKAAMMVTADRLAHDEIDASKLDIISDFQARLQHSDFKQTHVFSHPSLPEIGVHSYWLISDQKHWFVKCRHCKKWDYMDWNTEDESKMSVCFERRIYQCKNCKGELSDNDRRLGKWVAKYKDKQFSGYWVPLLIAPWFSAGELIDKFQNKNTSKEFFFTKMLGVPYADGASKLLKDHFFQNLTGELYAADKKDRVVIGIDTGLNIDYVVGNSKGLFHYGESKDYSDLNMLMKRWPNAIAVIDQGGDLIGSRKFYERWRGRVYLCALTGDRKTKELVSWGKGNEHGSCTADRNRIIQLTVDEFRDKRIPVHGTEEDWYEYYVDWSNLSRIKIIDSDTTVIKGYKWARSGRDHKALATVFWRIGMRRFSGKGVLFNANNLSDKLNSYTINPDNTVNYDPKNFPKGRGGIIS